MPFDPTQPFEPVNDKPAFDPSQPHEAVAVADFDPTLPFEAVDDELTSEQVAGYGAQLQEAATGFGSPIGATARLGAGLGIPLPLEKPPVQEVRADPTVLGSLKEGKVGQAIGAAVEGIRRKVSTDIVRLNDPSSEWTQEQRDAVKAVRERFQTQGGTLKEFADALAATGVPQEDAFNMPMFTFGKPEGEALAGVAQTISAAEGTITPTNVMIGSVLPGAPTLVKTLAGAYFGAVMGKPALEALPEIGTNIAKGELTEAGKGLVDFGVGLGFATGAAAGMSGTRPKGGRIVEMDATRMAQDLTAKAKLPIAAPIPAEPVVTATAIPGGPISGEPPFVQYLQDIVGGKPVRVYHGSYRSEPLTELKEGSSLTTHLPTAEKFGKTGAVYEAQMPIPENSPVREIANDLLKGIESGEQSVQAAQSNFEKRVTEIRNKTPLAISTRKPPTIVPETAIDAPTPPRQVAPKSGLVPAFRDRKTGDVFYGKPGRGHIEMTDQLEQLDRSQQLRLQSGFSGPDGKFLNAEEAHIYALKEGINASRTEGGKRKLDALGYAERKYPATPEGFQKMEAASSNTPAAPFSPEGLQAPPSKRAGITAQPGITDPTALNRALTTAIGWLRPRGHHPEEQYARLQVRDSEIAAGDRVIAYASRDLMTALKEQYGLSKVEMLGGGTKRIPVADVQWMTRYLKGDPVAQNFVPPKVRGPLDTMRAAIDSKSQQVIDRLVADQRTLRPNGPEWQRIQDTIDTVRGNMDLYVHRAYKFFDSKEPAPDWYNRLPAGVRQNAENYIAGSTPVPLPPLEARSRILDWLSDLKDQKVGSGKLGAKDPSILMHKHLSSPELRAVLGEYGSPLELYAKSMGKMTKWVANHRFLNDVRDMGMGRWLFEEGTNPPGFNARIAAEGSESMSPLNGLRTTHEIAAAFDSLYTSNTPWAATRWYYAVVAQSKFAATAQSLMTQSRNLLGRPMMALMAGHWNPKHVGTAGKAIWADLAGNDKRWQAFTKEAYDYGVLGDTAHGAEMQATLRDAALQDVDPASLYSWSLTRAVKEIGFKIPGAIYRASDDVGNLVGWLNEIESQKAIHPHLSDAQIKRLAAGLVRDIYPTYSETPAIVQAFRKVPLTGAFVTFPYQTVRTAYNSTMRGLLEVRSTNAAERVVGAKRLAGVATVLSAPFILQEVSKLATGVNAQQEDDYRSYQPNWSRNSRFAFLDQDAASGEVTAINLSYLDPYSYMTDPIMSAISSMRIDEPVDAAIARATHEFFRPWIDEQMVTRAIVDSARNKTTTGREVYNETDAAYQKATAISRHIGEALTPGTIRRASTRIIPALRGEQTAYGRKLEPVTEIAREVSGIALEKFNFKNGLAAKVKPFRDKVDASEDVFRRAATQVATTSPTQIVDAYRTSEERRQSQYRQMRGFYLAAVRQGVDPEEAEEILESRGMSKRDIRNIATGQYEPLKLTPAIRQRAAAIGRDLPEDEIQSIQDEASSVTLD